MIILKFWSKISKSAIKQHNAIKIEKTDHASGNVHWIK
jgi:hypothetical protein